MCLIIIKPKDVELPSDSHLLVANRNNDDGIGVAVKFADKARILIKKDFENVVDFIAWVHKEVKKEDTMIVHFRWATSGKTDKGNRHPFPITRNKELLRKTELWCSWAVAHNGVLSNYSGHKKYSDTQKFTLDILASQAIKENLKDKTIQKMLADFIGTDKLALLNEDGTLIRIGNFNKGEDDCYYSNDGYKEVRTYYSYGGGQFGRAYHRDGLGNLVTTPNNTIPNSTPDSEISSTLFFDHCDGCGKKKKLIEIQSKHFAEESFYLCKACRKQYKKGKLERLDEEIGEIAEGVEEKVIDSQCDSCLTFHPASEMIKHGDIYYCDDCCNDWVKNTGTQLGNTGGYCG